jgi:hypothetical protein
MAALVGVEADPEAVDEHFGRHGRAAAAGDRAHVDVDQAVDEQRLHARPVFAVGEDEEIVDRPKDRAFEVHDLILAPADGCSRRRSGL